MEIKKIDKAFNLVGSQNKYQMGLIVILFFIWIEVTFILLGQSMIYMNPVFSCKQITNKIVNENQACLIIDQCEIINYFTLTSYMGLYCQNQGNRNFIQSIFTLGAFLGLIIINLISDTRGRKLSMGISLTSINLGNLAIIIGGNFKIFPILVIAQIFLGLGAFSLITLTYVILSDICNKDFKPRAIVYVNSAWGTSTILLGIIFLFEVSWFNFMLFIVGLPCLSLSIILMFYLLQSPQVYFYQRKRQQCLAIFRQISYINKKQFNQQKFSELISFDQQNPQNAQNKANGIDLATVLGILKQKQNLKHIIALTLIYGTANINYYGISYALQQEGFGFGWNNIIAGIVQISSFFYLNYFIPRTPRKTGIALFYTCVAVLGFLFLIDPIRDNQFIISTVLAASRLCATIGYTMIICIHIEIFPNKIQSTAAGMIQAIGLYGVFVAPLIVNLAQHINIDPVALISICLVFSVGPTIFLKQTFEKQKQKSTIIQSKKSYSYLQQSLLESNYDDNQKFQKNSDSTACYSNPCIKYQVQ